MKQIIKNYSFSASAHAITLTDFSTVRLDRLQLIVDTTTNKILYAIGDSSITTATVLTNVITLAALQGGESDTDKLQIVYDSLVDDPQYDGFGIDASAPTQLSGGAGIRGWLSGIFYRLSNALSVGGDVAPAATDSGNPVKIGGVYNSTRPTYTTGQRGDSQLDQRGNLKVTLYRGSSTDQLGFKTSNSDGNGTDGSLVLIATTAVPQLFNGTNFDRARGNQEVTLLSSSARTTTQTGSDITNYNGDSVLIVVLDVTSAGTGSITVSIEGKDSASGKYYTILTGSAVTTNNTNRYRVSPILAAVANSVAQDHLPRIFRITVTANNANSVTYSVGYCLVR